MMSRRLQLRHEEMDLQPIMLKHHLSTFSHLHLNTAPFIWGKDSCQKNETIRKDDCNQKQQHQT